MGWLSKLLGQGKRVGTPLVQHDEQPQPEESAPRAQHSDPLSTLARDKTRREEFLNRVLTQGVWILATAPRNVSDAKNPQELMRDIEKQAKELSQEQYGKPYTYALKGSNVLPIFSTDGAAGEFIGKLKLRMPTAFQVLGVQSPFWLVNEFGLTRVIFNPISDCETELSENEIKYMKSVVARQTAGSDNKQ